MNINFDALPSPCYVISEELLRKNLELLKSVQTRTGCKILLAQKGFSMFSTYPIIGEYLSGTTASSLYEARLGKEEMGGETHIYSPAYKDEEFDEIASICDHIVFNSFAQYEKYKQRAHGHECGLRVNPEYSEIATDIYNPCFTGSRLGITLENFQPDKLDGISGLHFHTLCEQNSDTLWRTLKIFDEKFGGFMPSMKWLNMGGGHHVTRANYDLEVLIKCIGFAQDKYGVQVYLEPGEAIALNTGFLKAQVLDVTRNGIDIAILDTSAACHMPDVLEMPYRPEIIGAKHPEELDYTFRLAGPTCLAGDVIGDYSFERKLLPGDTMVFTDMAHYTMVKNNTFNGIGLPSIAFARSDGRIDIVKQFGYEDFKSRLS